MNLYGKIGNWFKEFEWCFRRNQSYLFHLLGIIFTLKSLKKGRLIKFYRSFFLLKPLLFK